MEKKIANLPFSETLNTSHLHRRRDPVFHMLLPLNFDSGHIWTSEDDGRIQFKNATNRHALFNTSSFGIRTRNLRLLHYRHRANTKRAKSKRTTAWGCSRQSCAKNTFAAVAASLMQVTSQKKLNCTCNIRSVQTNFSTKICICMQPSPGKLF